MSVVVAIVGCVSSSGYNCDVTAGDYWGQLLSASARRRCWVHAADARHAAAAVAMGNASTTGYDDRWISNPTIHCPASCDVVKRIPGSFVAVLRHCLTQLNFTHDSSSFIPCSAGRRRLLLLLLPELRRHTPVLLRHCWIMSLWGESCSYIPNRTSPRTQQLYIPEYKVTTQGQ